MPIPVLDEWLFRIMGGGGQNQLQNVGLTVQPPGAPSLGQFGEAAAAMQNAPAPQVAPAPAPAPAPVAPPPPQGQSAVGTYAPPAAPRPAPAALTPGQIRAFMPEEADSAIAPTMPAGGRSAPVGRQAQAAPAAGSPAPRGGGIGGFLGNLLNPQGAAKNQTIGFLMNQGLDEGTATLLAGNKPALQKYLLDKSMGKASEFDERARAAQQYGLTGEAAQRFVLSGELNDGSNRQTAVIDGKLVDTNTGEVVGDYGDDKPGYRTLTPEEVAQVPNLDRAKTWQIGPDNKLYEVGGSGVEVNLMGEDALRNRLGEKTGDLWSTYDAAGSKAADRLQDFEALSELSKVAPQGPITGRLAEMFPGYDSAGAAFTSIVKRMAPTFRVEGSGSTSDIEYAGMLQSLPQLQNRPEGNLLILEMMKAKAQLDRERGQVVRDFQANRISKEAALDKMSELEGRSIATPQFRTILEQVGGGDGGEMPPGLPDEDRALWPNMSPRGRELLRKKYGGG